MAKKSRIFTVYDAMDFPDYEFQPYPKMLYHPMGEQEIENQGQMENMPWGPELRNRTYRVKTALAVDKEAEVKLLNEGWHLTLEQSKLAREGKGVASLQEKEQEAIATVTAARPMPKKPAGLE